jgi:hypothetical protein
VSPGSGNIYGIYADGTTTNPFTLQSTNAMQRTTVNVNSTTTGRNCALYVSPTATCQFAARDCVFFANAGTGATAVGIESGGTGSFLSIKTSSCSGTTNDIKQDTGGLTGAQSTIQLSSTDLLNANADANGFTVNTCPSQLQFIVTSTIGNNNTFYLSPGSVSSTNLTNDNIVSIPFSQKLIIFGWAAYYSGTINNPVVICIYNTSSPTSSSASGTLISTITLNTANQGPIRLQNFSSTFTTSNYLQVVLRTSGGTVGSTNDALLITLSTY